MRIYVILLVLTCSLTACKEKPLLSEKDCIESSMKILKSIKHANYESVANQIRKYKEYQNYSVEDLKKEYLALQNGLNNININNLRRDIKSDTITIDYGATKEHLINIKIKYSDLHKEIKYREICEFQYSKEIQDTNFQLISFFHAYRVARKMVKPEGVTPTPPEQK